MIKPAHVTLAGNMNRVVVIGTSCVGKTIFARSLAEALCCLLVELDALYWQPNWIPRPPDEFQELVAKELPRSLLDSAGRLRPEIPLRENKNHL